VGFELLLEGLVFGGVFDVFEFEVVEEATAILKGCSSFICLRSDPTTKALNVKLPCCCFGTLKFIWNGVCLTAEELWVSWPSLPTGQGRLGETTLWDVPIPDRMGQEPTRCPLSFSA